VGGSLGRGRAPLRTVVGQLVRAARDARVLVVPGGGVFADRVRREHRRLGIDAATAHRMALRATDQFGLLLAAQHPRAVAVTDLDAAVRVCRRGRLAVLLPAVLVERRPSLERTFRLTSDSIAAWVASAGPARSLLVLKRVRGLDRFSADGTGFGDLQRRGVLDPLFARHLPSGLAVRVAEWRRALAPGRRGHAGRPPVPSGGAPARTAARGARRAGRGGRRSTAPRARR